MKKTLLSLPLLLVIPNSFAGGEADLLNESPGLKKLVCLTQAASPAHTAPREYGCPGSERQGGAKTVKSPASLPPGQRIIKDLYNKIRYEIFGPRVVNRSSFTSGAPGDCHGSLDVGPMNLKYRPGSYDKCVAALYFDFEHTKEGMFPMTKIYSCGSHFCGDDSIRSLKGYITEEKIEGFSNIELFLGCKDVEYSI